MGKHSWGSSGSFFASLAVSAARWSALAALAVLLVIGGARFLRHRSGPTPQASVRASGPAKAMPSSPPVASSPVPASPAGAKPQVQILNGTDNPQLLKAARSKVEAAGYPVALTEKIGKAYSKTSVFYQEGFDDQGKALGEVFAAPAAAAPRTLEKKIPLALIVGSDFKP